MVTLDTNVAVYALTDDPAKSAKAHEIVGRSAFASVQVLNEAANVLSRKRRLPWSLVAEKLDQLSDALEEIVPVSVSAHQTAVSIAERYQLQFFDALMIAVALTNGATTLFSEDMQHGLLIDDTLRIENPFA